MAVQHVRGHPGRGEAVSLITDLVISTPGRVMAGSFQDEFAKHQNYRPEPVDHAGRPTGMFVFNIGVNYMMDELRAWIESQVWPAGTMIYIDGESDVEPTIITVPGARVWDDE